MRVTEESGRTFFEWRDALERDTELVLVEEARGIVQKGHVANINNRHRVKEESREYFRARRGRSRELKASDRYGWRSSRRRRVLPRD